MNDLQATSLFSSIHASTMNAALALRMRTKPAASSWVSLTLAAAVLFTAALPLTAASADSSNDCVAVTLSEPLSWPTSGAWYRSPSGPGLLVADVARDPHQLLTISTTGKISVVASPAGQSPFGFAAFVRSGGKEILVEDKAGVFFALSRDLSRRRSALEMNRVAVDGRGKIADLLDWTWADGTLLGLAYVNGGSSPGLSLLEIGPTGQARTVETLQSGELVKTWYAQTAGNLATLDGDAFFLDLGAGPRLKRVAPGANNSIELEVTSARYAGGPALDDSRPWREEQALKLSVPGSGKRQAFLYFDLLERSAVVAGLYRGGANELFMLTKKAMDAAGETLWTLIELNPTTGQEVRSFVLPTTAAHLTVIPPDAVGSRWAILERARVGRRAADGAPTFGSSRLLLLSAPAVAHPPLSWQNTQVPPRCGG